MRRQKKKYRKTDLRPQKRDAKTCPICGCKYEAHIEGKHTNTITHHHIFPRGWYDIELSVRVCHECHCKKFNKWFQMGSNPWSKKLCLFHWVDFCMRFGKNAFEIYPQLNRFKYLMP